MAPVVYVEPADWPVLQKYLAALGKGGILVSPLADRAICKFAGIMNGDRLDEVEEYDFGGLPDVAIDVVDEYPLDYAGRAVLDALGLDPDTLEDRESIGRMAECISAAREELKEPPSP